MLGKHRSRIQLPAMADLEEKVAVQIPPLWIVLQGQTGVIYCFLNAPHTEKNGAHIGIGLQMIGINLQSFCGAFQRLVEAPQIHQADTHVAMGVGIARLNLQRALEASHGLIYLPHGVQRHANAVISHGLAIGEQQCCLIHGNGLLVASCFEQEVRTVAQGQYMRRFQFDGAAIRCFGIVVFIHEPQRFSYLVVNISTIRQICLDAAVVGERLRDRILLLALASCRFCGGSRC